jgi:hypothetical protein
LAESLELTAATWPSSEAHDNHAPIHARKKKSVTFDAVARAEEMRPVDSVGREARFGLRYQSLHSKACNPRPNRQAREPIADGLPGHTEHLRDLGIATTFFTAPV